MKLVLNGKEIEVEGRQTILDVARENGIEIPSLCDIQRLNPFSGCRLCLVEIEGRKGFSPSCSTDAEEGMVVKTDTPQLKKLRRQILELILSEHPSACLICSEKQSCDEYKSTIRKVGETTGCVLCPNNGRCELQDVVEALEIDKVNFPALYRNFDIKKEDPFFDRNYNLCILCGRCVRVCHDVRGASAISFVYRGSDEVIGTVFDKPLIETGCQFCGACVDVCPTGALTERTIKYEMLPEVKRQTICPLCSVGCTLDVELRNGKMISARPAEKSPVNRGQACVKGRFVLKDVVHSPQRITKPKIRKDKHLEEVGWDEALDFVARKLKTYKSRETAVVESMHLTCEDIYTCRKFAREVLKTKNVVSSTGWHPEVIYKYLTDEGNLQIPLNFSMSDISKARTILLLGTDLPVSHPIVWLEVLDAVKNGANFIVASPTESPMTRHATQWLRHPAGAELVLLGYLSKIITEDEQFLQLTAADGYETFLKPLNKLSLPKLEEKTGVKEQELRKVSQYLLEDGTAAILFGLEFLLSEGGNLSLPVLQNLARLTSGRLYPLGLENNQRGYLELSGLSSGKTKNVFDITKGVEDGQIKALYMTGTFPWPKKMKPEFTVYQGSFDSETAQKADAVLPAAIFAETQGTYVNVEGRVQGFDSVIEPLGEAKPDWWIVTRLTQKMKASGFDYKKSSDILKEMQKNCPGFAKVNPEELKKGKAIFLQEKKGKESGFVPIKFPPQSLTASKKYPFLLLNDYNLDVFRNLALSRASRGLKRLRDPEYILINPADAAAASLEEGARVEILSELGKTAGRVKISDAVCEGTLRSNFLWEKNPEFFAALLKSMSSKDFGSIRVLPVKLKRGK
ncbi:MAG: molybdopterin-dependent oxidoreductase [Candidatus Aminicenantes bacterium]|jgi:predicted molibdopterin-dependent oxidoreductase YjgC